MRGPKDRAQTKDRSGIKVVLVGAVLGLGLLALWARAYLIQIVDGPKLAKMASRQHWTAEEMRGRRGEIFDRHGRLLAQSVAIRSVSACPYQVEDKSGTAQSLAEILSVREKDLKTKLSRSGGFVWLARKISDRQASQIKELSLPGIYLVKDSLRTYPQGRLAGQLIGFVGADGQGLEGLEKAYDEHLAPTMQKVMVQRDASGKRLDWMPSPDDAGRDGRDLVLTLDLNVQFAAENALAKAVQEHDAKLGMCLVAHVPSGEILAWAQYPFFDPNRFRRYRPIDWKNRIALDVYEPGSTIKPFVAAAALEEKKCSANTLVFCENGKWSVDGERIRDTHEYDWLPVSKVVRYSSNIGMAKIGLELGEHNLHHYLDLLGFTRETGIHLTSQSSGIVRPPQQWTRVDLANAAFGQGLAVSCLQMARAYACLANNGVLPELFLDLEHAPGQGRQVFSPEVNGMILSMLRDVIQEDGTGTKARINGVVLAGKTGTAQKAEQGGYSERFLASFAALVPGDIPEYVILAMIDEPHPVHYGGLVAAPAVREVALNILSGQGRLPSAQPMDMLQADHRESPGINLDSASGNTLQIGMETADGQGTVPDLVGLSLHNVVQWCLEQGIVPKVQGQGIFVHRQQPAPGSAWPDAENGLTLWLSREGRSG